MPSESYFLMYKPTELTLFSVKEGCSVHNRMCKVPIMKSLDTRTVRSFNSKYLSVLLVGKNKNKRIAP